MITWEKQNKLTWAIEAVQEPIDHGLKHARCFPTRKKAWKAWKKARKNWADGYFPSPGHYPDKHLLLAAFDFGFNLGVDELRQMEYRKAAKISRDEEGRIVVRWEPVVRATAIGAWISIVNKDIDLTIDEVRKIGHKYGESGVCGDDIQQAVEDWKGKFDADWQSNVSQPDALFCVPERIHDNIRDDAYAEPSSEEGDEDGLVFVDFLDEPVFREGFLEGEKEANKRKEAPSNE